MNTDTPLQERGLFHWIVRRNPAYLVSACLTAAGARLLLASPANAVSDIRFIVVTLIVLQAYEWAVGAILIALHRSRRSPEDRPSLLLVAAAFWTGPIAATIEMIALRPQLGSFLAVGACLLAMGELRLCCKLLGIRMTTAGQIIGSACVLMLATSAPLMKIPESNSGVNEIVLFMTWWLFAGLGLACLVPLRAYHPRRVSLRTHSLTRNGNHEAMFLSITFVATGLHLIGMNYGFFCHAMPFYASPLIVSASLVGMLALPINSKWRTPALSVLSFLPCIAIFLATRRFSEEFPIHKLPTWLREPSQAVSIIAVAAWSIGSLRHQSIILLHMGCAATVLGALGLTNDVVNGYLYLPRTLELAFLCCIISYLILVAWLFRSRWEILAALLVNLYLSLIVTNADTLIMYFVIGWSGLVGMHVAVRRPRFLWRFAPIAFLAIAPWTLEAAPAHKAFMISHAVALMLILLIAGQIWKWTRYSLVAVLLLVAYAGFAAMHCMMQSGHPLAATLVCAGFTALLSGAFISWNKGMLLALLSRNEPESSLDGTAPDLNFTTLQ